MNDLILFVVKERVLPLTSDFIDYPSRTFESQLHHISHFLAKSILDQFVRVTHWSLCNASAKNQHCITEHSRLTLALQNTFPLDWLTIAEKSPTHHLHLQRVIQRYRFSLQEASIRRIHAIVEFFCFELIESAVILSNFKPMHQLGAADLQFALDRDPVLKKIVTQHQIVIVPRVPMTQWISFAPLPGTMRISNKGYRLLRTYIEELIREVIRARRNPSLLTLTDIHDYFKHPRV